MPTGTIQYTNTWTHSGGPYGVQIREVLLYMCKYSASPQTPQTVPLLHRPLMSSWQGGCKEGDLKYELKNEPLM